MARFLLKRLGLAVITLFLLSVLVFIGAQMLPGNVARRILGPFADQAAVDNLNHQLGTDRPILTQYWDWLTGLFRGDLGDSFSYHVPVSQLLGAALVNSLKLAAVAFVIVVPLAILGGIVAALRRDTPIDRAITHKDPEVIEKLADGRLALHVKPVQPQFHAQFFGHGLGQLHVEAGRLFFRPGIGQIVRIHGHAQLAPVPNALPGLQGSGAAGRVGEWRAIENAVGFVGFP